MASLVRQGLPIRFRLALGYALLLVVIVAAVGAYLLTALESALRAEVDQSLALHAGQIERELVAVAGDDGLSAAEARQVLAGSLRREPLVLPNLYIQVDDPEGRPLAATANLPGLTIPGAGRPVPPGAGEEYADTRVNGERLRFLRRPIGESTNPLGSLIVGESMHVQEATLRRIGGLLLLAGAIGGLVALLGGWMLTARALGPIREITRVARRIAATGRFEQRIAVPPRRDELGELAATFNDMLARLERTFGRQKEFLADASHELRGPLMVIRGNLDLLRLDLPPAERAQSVREATEEVDRMANLVSDLLFLSEVDAPETVAHAPVALHEVVAEVYARARDVDGGQHELALAENDPATVLGDRERLGQMVWNLVENGLRYTPPGGRVTLALRRQGQVAEVLVADTGIGIPAEHLPRIFERFYRVDRARSRSQGGTGLGLAIVKQIAEAHGGQVRVRSEPGVGSTFTVALPATG